MNSTYETCRVKRIHYEYDCGENPSQDPLIIGIDLSEEDAIDLNVPIRPGPNGEKYIWPDDIDPQ